MVKKLYADNFKSLNGFEMDFEQFTVVVGNNMSGKSTVLQALELPGDVPKSSVEWELQIQMNSSKNGMELWKEKVQYKWEDETETLLSYGQAEEERFVCENGKRENLPRLQPGASVLKLMDLRDYPTLSAVKQFFENSDSFELLSPEKMRSSSRGDVNTIGSAGEKLPYQKSAEAVPPRTEPGCSQRDRGKHGSFRIEGELPHQLRTVFRRFQKDVREGYRLRKTRRDRRHSAAIPLFGFCLTARLYGVLSRGHQFPAEISSAAMSASSSGCRVRSKPMAV